MLRIMLVSCLSLAAATAWAQDSQESPAKSFVYKKTPQAELELFVDYPPDWKAGDKRPAIVFFFGGGWTNGKVGQFEVQAAHLAKRGMVAARADYRVKSRHQVAPNDCVEDAKSAVRWIRQNAAKLGIDGDRIVAAGGSAGGHIAACTSLTPGLDNKDEDLKISSKPNAMILFNPVLNFYQVPTLHDRVKGDEISKAISPVLHLAKETPPTLLFYGTTDKLKTQGDEFEARAKALGQRTEMFSAPDVGHGFFNKEPWQGRTLDRADEFLVSIGYLKERSK